MESGHDKRCAKCNAPAKNKCSRCKSVVYCDKNCQSSHWHQHQMTCNKPGQVIQRAGEVLQRLFLVWREHALSRSWDEICDTGELVVVHELPSSGSLHSFPYHLVQNDSQKEMVISADYCTDFVGRFGPILGHLIKSNTHLPSTYDSINEGNQELVRPFAKLHYVSKSQREG